MPAPHPDQAESRPAVSFEALFRAHHEALCTFAYRYVLARDVAEELVAASPKAVLVDLGVTVSTDYAIKTSMHMCVVDQQRTLVYDGALDKESDRSQNFVAAALDVTRSSRNKDCP